jgi:hypothetical protein
VPNETHLTITIPGTVSPTTLGPLRDRLEHAVQSCLAAPCDIAEGAVTLHRDDARVAGYAMLHALRLQESSRPSSPTCRRCGTPAGSGDSSRG